MKLLEDSSNLSVLKVEIPTEYVVWPAFLGAWALLVSFRFVEGLRSREMNTIR